MEDWRQELFSYMSQEHNITLMDSEIDDIEYIVKRKGQVKWCECKKGIIEIFGLYYRDKACAHCGLKLER